MHLRFCRRELAAERAVGDGALLERLSGQRLHGGASTHSLRHEPNVAGNHTDRGVVEARRQGFATRTGGYNSIKQVYETYQADYEITNRVNYARSVLYQSLQNQIE
jgi:hypothetical protein